MEEKANNSAFIDGANLYKGVIRDFFEEKYNRAVIISSDGDYASLVEFLKEKKALLSLISPSNKCSYLLRKLDIPIIYLNTQQKKLEYQTKKEKAPNRNGTR